MPNNGVSQVAFHISILQPTVGEGNCWEFNPQNVHGPGPEAVDKDPKTGPPGPVTGSPALIPRYLLYVTCFIVDYDGYTFSSTLVKFRLTVSKNVEICISFLVYFLNYLHG